MRHTKGKRQDVENQKPSGEGGGGRITNKQRGKPKEKRGELDQQKREKIGGGSSREEGCHQLEAKKALPIKNPQPQPIK